MRSLLRALLVASSIASSGCYGDDDVVVVVPPERVGLLTVRWSITGATVADDCSRFGADFFELLLYDRFGVFFFESSAPCQAFALSLELPEGIFEADATLVDSEDAAVSLTERIEQIVITSDSELVISIDYPPGSFL
jgi:hypothetical protein